MIGGDPWVFVYLYWRERHGEVGGDVIGREVVGGKKSDWVGSPNRIVIGRTG